MKKQIIWLGLILLACSCSAANEEYQSLFKCSKKLDKPYGICTHINRRGPRYEYDTQAQDVRMMGSAGAALFRTDWDLPSMIKKGSSGLDFSHFDRMVSTTDSMGMKGLAIITAMGNYRASDIDMWSNQVMQQVDHFKQVTYWEVINEVDICRRWLPNIYAKEYIDMLRKGYQAVKRGNRKAQVLFSGLANSDTNFLDSVLSAGVNNCFDIMNVHRYNHKKDEPESLLDYYIRLEKKLTKYQINKPLWLTECGCSTAEGWATEETQAMRLPRIFLISFACGVDKVFWYKSRSRELDSTDKEDFFGLWHKDYTPKPAFYAYQTLTRMCPNKSTRPKLVRYGKVYVASWKRPDGKRVWALWTSKNNEIVKLHVNSNYKCYDIFGKIKTFPNQIVETTPSILYFEGGRKFEQSLLDSFQ